MTTQHHEIILISSSTRHVTKHVEFGPSLCQLFSYGTVCVSWRDFSPTPKGWTGFGNLDSLPVRESG